MSDLRSHWEGVYSSKNSADQSWHQPHLRQSLELFSKTQISQDDHIIDIGGGASTFADDLLDRGYRNVTVVDISPHALEISKKRLAERAHNVEWIAGDILEITLPKNRCQFWHDRAVFHFLIDAIDRKNYVEQVRHAMKPGGFVLLATFSINGPQKCSGLEVCRYTPERMLKEFGDEFQLTESRAETHTTPAGKTQAFIYCLMRFTATPAL
ncbi:MAG: class I SAM-dependent methyltransferase [Bacteroidota bacterium]